MFRYPLAQCIGYYICRYDIAWSLFFITCCSYHNWFHHGGGTSCLLSLHIFSLKTAIGTSPAVNNLVSHFNQEISLSIRPCHSSKVRLSIIEIGSNTTLSCRYFISCLYMASLPFRPNFLRPSVAFFDHMIVAFCIRNIFLSINQKIICHTENFWGSGSYSKTVRPNGFLFTGAPDSMNKEGIAFSIPTTKDAFPSLFKYDLYTGTGSWSLPVYKVVCLTSACWS